MLGRKKIRAKIERNWERRLLWLKNRGVKAPSVEIFKLEFKERWFLKQVHTFTWIGKEHNGQGELPCKGGARCVLRELWGEWQDWNMVSEGSVDGNNYCSSCLPEVALELHWQSRCHVACHCLGIRRAPSTKSRRGSTEIVVGWVLWVNFLCLPQIHIMKSKSAVW